MTLNALPEAPIYTLKKVPKNYCSRYARYAARDLFGRRYYKAHAWLFADRNHVVCEVQSNAELATINLEPGMIVGFHYPDSSHGQNTDEFGRPIICKHLALCIGNNHRNDLMFVHQVEEKPLRESLTEIDRRGLEAKIVFNSRK